MFLKIRDLYVNVDHIESIKVEEETADIYTDAVEDLNLPAWVLRGRERQALLDWLEYKAEVSVVI